MLARQIRDAAAGQMPLPNCARGRAAFWSLPSSCNWRIVPRDSLRQSPSSSRRSAPQRQVSTAGPDGCPLRPSTSEPFGGRNAMLKRALTAFAVISALGVASSSAWSQAKDIRFHELATDTNRFKGFKARVKRQPMQSFWSNTIEVSLAVHARNKDKISKWADLNGKRVFTGPLPFDVRAHLERAMAALDIKFTYVQIDLAAAGSQLESGAIDAMNIYTGAEKAPPPWLAEASLAADWAALNPSAAEIAELKKKNFSVVEVSPDVFKRNVHVAKVIELPFYYGFHVGLDVPADDVVKMLKIIEANAAELAKTDPTFSQIAQDIVGFQKRGVESSADLVPIHPGLAKYMREKGVWDKKWDSKIATM